MDRAAQTVVVPAHITGFFSSHPDPNPLVAGSRGAGITLADAVTVRLDPSEKTRVTVNDHQTHMPAVSYVLEELAVTAEISASVDVPLGAGFGISGAIALGTAYAANRFSDDHRSENELVSLAHAGDVVAGTGLGDVVAQHRGGVPIRVDPGAPGYATLDGVAATKTVEWVSRGELSTAAVLAGDTTAIDQAGAAALERLRREPTLERFMDESLRFAREAELLTPSLESIVEDVEAAGGKAAMAMLGHTVFALGNDLTLAGYEPTRSEMATGGVRFVRSKAED